MDSFKELINRQFNFIEKISIREDNEISNLNDTIIFNSKTNSAFQILSRQTGIMVKEMKDKNVVIDGEFEIDEIIFHKIHDIGNFIVRKVDILWDINKIYIIGFIFYSLDLSLYFLRTTDEIELVDKKEFDKLLLATKVVVEVEQ